MTLAAGDLNRRFAIEVPGATKDAANQPIKTWTPFISVWGKILGANGMSAVRAAQEGVGIAPGRYSIRIRYRPTGLDVGMRAVYQGVFFDIKDIRHDFAGHDYTDLVCETGANDG